METNLTATECHLP